MNTKLSFLIGFRLVFMMLCLVTVIGGQASQSWSAEGWYLMVPPIREKEVRTEAPLRQWHKLDAFDTAGQCNDAKRGLVMELFQQQSKARAAGQPADEIAGLELNSLSAMLSRCVAASDFAGSEGSGGTTAWYFLLPPSGHAGTVWRTEAALWRWEQDGAFPSAQACEDNRDLMLRSWDRNVKEFAVVNQAIRDGVCVASTDPRLTPPVHSAPVYLLMPPFNFESLKGLPDPNAPLSAWAIQATFDSAETCEAERDDLSWFAMQQPGAKEPLTANEAATKTKAAAVAIQLSQCVLATDPRFAPTR
jgi:hypothetical protein